MGTNLLVVFLCRDLSKSREKPNVLFLFADDQCFETIGSLGLTDIDTPLLIAWSRTGPNS